MAKGKSISAGFDYMLLVPVLLLIGLGLVMVYSASSQIAAHRLGDSYFFLKRQVLFCIIGLCLMLVTKHIPCTLYSKLVYPMLLLSFFLLMILLVPGIGHRVGGAARWLKWGEFSFQPSELAKFSLAVYMAYSLSKKGSNMESFSRGFLPHLIVAGSLMTLILLQPDLGTAVIMGCWVLIVLFVGGVKLVQLFSIVLLFVPVVL